jgi:hypothetical protein
MAGLWIYGISQELLWILCGVAGLGAAWLIMIRAKVSG